MRADASLIIWFPASIDEVRPALHRSGVAKGALVAVDSGTVVVPHDRMSVSIAAQWVYRAHRKLGRTLVLVAWNHEAAVVYPIAGAVAPGWGWGEPKAGVRMMADLGGMGPVRRAALSVASGVTNQDSVAKQARAARRIGTALGVDEAVVLPFVQQHKQYLPPDQLLDACGKPDVAKLVRKVDAGAFDNWRSGRTLSMTVPNVLLTLSLVASAVVLFVLSIVDIVAVLISLLLAVALLIIAQRLRYRYARRPVDEVLPVVQAPEASDNQSAR